MKVRELIEYLKQGNPDAEVVHDAENGYGIEPLTHGISFATITPEGIHETKSSDKEHTVLRVWTPNVDDVE